MSTPDAPGGDRGLEAVLRVRTVRERDSRIGLQRAMLLTRQRELDTEQARARLDAAAGFEQGSAAAFLADRGASAALAHAVVRLTTLTTASMANVTAAERRWRLDRSRRRAVELILQRRAERRDAERERRRTAELDDLATQQWLRGNTGVSTPASNGAASNRADTGDNA
ncbi:MAG TPA: hypothetical protein VFJ14_09220 [Nocardioidaceae bacterium]|nr:hypothetical protein [Nocardioidaceae bacterium]